MRDVIEAGILLTNPTDFAGLNEEYARWFPSEPSTRYVAKLGVTVLLCAYRAERAGGCLCRLWLGRGAGG